MATRPSNLKSPIFVTPRAPAGSNFYPVVKPIGANVQFWVRVAQSPARPLAPEDFDFPSAKVAKDPFDFYSVLRSTGPVYKLPQREEYVISRWEDITFVARHPEIFSSRKPIGPGHPRTAAADVCPVPGHKAPYNMAWSDGDEHKARRSLAMKLVTRERLQRYEPMIQSIVTQLIDGFIDEGKVEFGSQFADILPIWIVCDILGLPREDVPLFTKWTGVDQGDSYNAQHVSETRRQELLESSRQMAAYMRDALLDRHRRPREDFLSEYVSEAVSRDGELDLPYLVADATIFLNGGHVTTTHMLGSTMLLLLRHPEVMERARTDLSQIRPLIEDSLRLESPVQWHERICMDETQVGGVTIPSGALVLVIWASGNRDESKWTDPAEFGAERPGIAKDQLAFGYGAHLCLGAPLARLEGRIALENLLTRLSKIRLAPGKNEFAIVGGLHHRGIRTLHLEFDRA
jgi:cytochrome P450